MEMIQSSTAIAIFIATIFISSLVTNSAFAQAQSMNQSMNNAGGGSTNQTMTNMSQESNQTLKEMNQSAN